METANEPGFGGKLPSENLAPYIDISPINHVDQIQTQRHTFEQQGAGLAG